MAKLQISCFKGIKPEDEISINLESGTTLEAVRELLEKQGFIPKDNTEDGIGYRFVEATSPTMIRDDVMVSIKSEKRIPFEDVLRNGKQLIISNYYSLNKADMLGFGTDWWFDRYLGVQCKLNMSDPYAKEKNKDKFPPMMLTDIILSSVNIPNPYKNVCICCEGSLVEFWLCSWGGAGFGFRIAPVKGEPIASGMIVPYQYPDKDLYGYGMMRRWQEYEKGISIVGTDSVTEINPREALKYQKIIFTSSNMSSCTKGGVVNESSSRPPSLTVTHSKTRSKSSTTNTPENAIRSNAANSADRPVTWVPGDSIKEGVPVPEGSSEQKWNGGALNGYKLDSWDDNLGEISVYFFVFKTLKDAEKVIKSLNAPTNLWK